MSAYQSLKDIFITLADLNHLDAIAGWDEAVMMPEGAGHRRAQALAKLQAIRHGILVDPKNEDLLEQAKSETLESEWDKANLKWMEELYLKATCVPSELVHALTEASFKSQQAWRQMRADNDWEGFKPYLQKTLDLVKEIAEIKADVFNEAPYDILIDEFSPALNQKIIDPIFAELKDFLPGFCQQVIEQQASREYISFKGHYPIEKQKLLGIELMKAIGFDFNRGRLDVSHHPFTGGDHFDVRITTRYDENDFAPAMMAVCHETGHGMYELGLPDDWADQPVGSSLGMSVHESQSLLIEMQACRSYEFLQFLASKAKTHFGDEPAFAVDNLFNIYTKVKPDFIRVDADEVTYPLHVIMRYEIEKQLIAGDLSLDDLPQAWDHAMQSLFGLSTNGNYKNGVMQDVHWPSGCFGYFPAYTIGSIIAAQVYQAALKACPAIPNELKQGNFSTLIQWLRENIHGYGSLYSTEQLVLNASGVPLSTTPYIQHLQRRYIDHSQLYLTPF